MALSMGVVIAAGGCGTAFAQSTVADQNNPPAQNVQSPPPDQDKATQLQSVVVTGSHIRRVDLETSSPVVSVDRVAIEATGDLTLGQLIQDLPAMTGGVSNPQVNNGGGGGSSSVNLRGLGPSRSLILVDGHRVLSGDTNAIPAAMIDRIDVLTDGASAVYGSDAIGGVVNFITRKEYQGAQFTADYGQSSHADGRTHGYTFTFGQASDKGSIVAGVGYNKTDGVQSNRRKFSENAVSLYGSSQTPIAGSIGGSGSSPYGDIQIPGSGPVHDAFAGCGSGNLARNPGASGMDPINDYHCYQNSGPNSDKYNYATVNLIMTPQERTNAFILGTYKLSSNVSAYLNAYYTKTRSAFQIAPGVYGSPYGANISADNYYNPFGIEYSSNGAMFLTRLSALSNRSADYGRHDTQFSTGLKGMFTMFDQDWNWDVGIDYGHSSTVTTTLGLANNNKLYTGPSFMGSDGIVHCGTPGNIIDGCDGSFNPFALDSPESVAALQASASPAISNSYSQERIYRADVNGGLFDLPAGTVQLALGASYRKDHTKSLVDPLLNIDQSTGTCILGSQCSSGLQGGFNVKETYAEMFIPILQDVPFANSLNVTIGDRYSRFSSFGSTNNKKFAIEWRPINDLLLRGTIAEVFRAPAIGSVYGAPGNDAPRLTFDPCDGYTGNPVNPACVNVPTDGSFINSNVKQQQQVNTITAGSAYAGFPIKPESGKSFDFGAVYSPSWATGLSASVDFWHVYLNDIITTVGLQSLLNLCSAGQTTYCQYIHRHPSGPQQGQLEQTTLEPTGNLGSVQVGGVDGTLAYRLDTQSLGHFDFRVNATYLKYYDQRTAPGLPGNITYHNAGHLLTYGSAAGAACSGGSECLYPRIRANGSVRWQKSNWSASWRMRYIGGFRMGSPSPSQDVHPAGGALDGVYYDYGSTLYHDVSVGYNIKPLHTRVDLGVNNLFDRQPPFLYANNTNNSNTVAGDFDLLGRYYWARVTVDF